MLNKRKTEAYCAILAEELRLATGCTEPIAVAYCAAKLREVLGGKPEKVLAEISGNILKNVKSVVVPNTGGRRGIEAAIAVGIVAGDADSDPDVLREAGRAAAGNDGELHFVGETHEGADLLGGVGFHH